MKESSMANAKPPECNSISTTKVAVIDITKGAFNGVKLVRETSILLCLPNTNCGPYKMSKMTYIWSRCGWCGRCGVS